MVAPIVSAERLREALSYDPLTGVFRWKVRTSTSIHIGDIAGSTRGGGGRYRYIGIDGRYYRAHRLAWLYVKGHWPARFLDHINGDCFDNRIANLRDADPWINQQNQRRARADNKLGFLGVSPHQSKYLAQISADGRLKYLGRFDTPEAAHAAYVEAKRRLHAGCTI